MNFEGVKCNMKPQSVHKSCKAVHSAASIPQHGALCSGCKWAVVSGLEAAELSAGRAACALFHVNPGLTAPFSSYSLGLRFLPWLQSRAGGSTSSPDQEVPLAGFTPPGSSLPRVRRHQRQGRMEHSGDLGLSSSWGR